MFLSQILRCHLPSQYFCMQDLADYGLHLLDCSLHMI